MGDTSIEWTDKTWNPVRGCIKVSPGCRSCYAETFAERWRGIAGHPYEQGFDPRLVPGKLGEPLRWTKPVRVFVNSMSDLFGEFVDDEYIAAVFGVMAATPRHTFQVLTKRAERLPAWFQWLTDITAMAEGGDAHVRRCIYEMDKHGITRAHVDYPPWPLPNVHLGVSVEDRKYGLPRIDHLRTVPAALRFLSVEPLLEDLGEIDLTGIGWVIVGGESGNGARPLRLEWIRSIVKQCKAASIPVFVKQLGAKPIEVRPAEGGAHGSEEALARLGEPHPQRRWFPGWTLVDTPDGASNWVKYHRLSGKGGDMAEWPEDLRVREWPKAIRSAGGLADSAGVGVRGGA